MAWAQEMKNLAADIRTSHKDRSARVGEIKSETRDILSDADAYMKELGKALRDFLAKSEADRKKSEVNRKKDFNAMMGGIQTDIKEMKTEVKNFLEKSDEKRVADFKDMMKDIKTSVANTLNATKDMLENYTSERKEAARYWAGISGKREVEKEEIEAPETPKGKRSRKKK